MLFVFSYIIMSMSCHCCFNYCLANSYWMADDNLMYDILSIHILIYAFSNIGFYCSYNKEITVK